MASQRVGFFIRLNGGWDQFAQDDADAHYDHRYAISVEDASGQTYNFATEEEFVKALSQKSVK